MRAVEEPGLLRTFWNALSFSEIRTAMKLVIRHMFVKPVTFQYPREKRTIPDAHRGALSVACGVSDRGLWLIHHPSTVDCRGSLASRI